MEQYLKLLGDVKNNGRIKEDRTGTGTVSSFGRQMRFDLSLGLPILTTKKMHLKGILYELLWFIRGDTNTRYLTDNGVSIWDHWQDENGDLGPIYSVLWRRWPVDNGRPIILPIRKGPDRGPVEIPKNTRSQSKLESDYNGDLGVYHENHGTPFRIISDLGTQGGKNSNFLIQFEKSQNVIVKARPEIRRGKKLVDVLSPELFEVACLGFPKNAPDRRYYDLWYNMISRCYNPDNPVFDYYGGDGVYVSPRWLCFENFLNDLSRLPQYEQWVQKPWKYSLDKDYYGSKCYDVSTCIFIDIKENRAMGNQLRPLKLTDNEGREFVFGSRIDAIEHVGVSDETFRNYENNKYNESKRMSEWIISEYIPPEGMLIRKQLVIDQLGDAIELLKTNPTSRRIIVSSWDPSLLPDTTLSPKENARRGKQALPPCHTLFQFYVEELTELELEKAMEQKEYLIPPKYRLSCNLYQRSADLPIGVPYNITSYSILTMMVAQVVNMVPGDFVWSGGDCHIYLDQLDGVSEQLTRTPKNLPILEINHKVNSIDDFAFEDFNLIGYDPDKHIPMPVAI